MFGCTCTGQRATAATAPSDKDLLSSLTTNFATKWCLDGSRKAFINDTSATLRQLILGDLVECTGYRRLLLGHKGVGKTTLLMSLQETARKHLGDFRLLCVYISYDDTESKDRLPVELIRKELREKYNLSVPDDIQFISAFEKWLAREDAFLFLVLDEFHLVYGHTCPKNGLDIVSEASSIGSSRLGRIHCVLSGSSSVLRRLCFSNISDSEAQNQGYVNFRFGIDLNSTKYTALWIDPFLEAENFRIAARILSKSAPLPEDDVLARIYLRTGGNPRLMETALRSKDDNVVCILTSRLVGYNNVEIKGILNSIISLVSVHRTRLPSLLNPLDSVASFTMLVDFSSVIQQASVSAIFEKDGNRARLDDMADLGLIRVHGTQLSLGNAALWIELTHGTTLTIEEMSAMLNPEEHT